MRLTVDGQVYTQPLIVKMDPRVKTSPAGLMQQFTLASEISAMMSKTKSDARLNGELAGVLAVIESSDEAPTTQAVEAVAELRKRVRRSGIAQ